MSIEHELKTVPPYFGHVASGLKTFDVRLTFDRSFVVGDTLRLREWVPDTEDEETLNTGRYTGREVRVRVTYVLAGPGMGVPKDVAVLGIALSPPRQG